MLKKLTALILAISMLMTVLSAFDLIVMSDEGSSFELIERVAAGEDNPKSLDFAPAIKDYNPKSITLPPLSINDNPNTSNFSISGIAALSAVSGDFEYSLYYENEARIDKYNGNATILSIPDKLDGYIVTAIGPSAFEGHSSITNITIPNGIELIYYNAFQNCTSLKNAVIPDSVIGMGNNVFSGCTSLTSAVIGNNVPNISRYVFGGCTSLSDVTIGEKVSGIQYGAFLNCTSLKNITLPKGLTSIALPDIYFGSGTTTTIGAFTGCTALESISVDKGNPYFSSIDGVLLATPSGFPYYEGIIDYTRLLMYPEGKTDAEYTIPDIVENIRASAFYQNKYLTKVTTPITVEDIGYSTFYQCEKLENVILPNGITSINNTMFYDCTSLKNINIPDSITAIGYLAFNGCTTLTSITIPDSVSSIGSSAFDECDSLTIRCNAGSTAHLYAMDNNIPYTLLGGGINFTVIFKNGNTVVDTQSVEMYKDAYAPKITKPGYKLSWDKPFYSITENVTVNAVWTTDPLFGKDGFVAVSAGKYHTLAIKSDGSLWAWGRNTYVQLGDGSTESYKSRPIKIMDGVASVSAGVWHTMAIKMNGELWAWGDNEYGALGDGTNENRSRPVKIMDGVESVSAGLEYTMAIKTNGELWAWGYNQNGELGDGTTVDKNRPVKIMDGVAEVSAGGSAYGGGHTLAVKRDGTLFGWGKNTIGQLGNGKKSDREIRPVQIMNNVYTCSVAGRHSMAIKKDGTLWGWGDNWDGQIGSNYYWLGDVRGNTEELYPVKIMDNVSSVAAMGETYMDSSPSTMAVRNDGSLWKWGGYGENGIPMKMGDNIYKISGRDKSFALIKKDGTLWTWGANDYGQLGDGTGDYTDIPNKIDTNNISTISANGANGSITETRNTSKITLTAIPNQGYWFEGWYEDNIKINGAEAVYSFNIAANRSLAARFLPQLVSSVNQTTTTAVTSTNTDYLTFYSELSMVQTYIAPDNKIYVMNIEYDANMYEAEIGRAHV